MKRLIEIPIKLSVKFKKLLWVRQRVISSKMRELRSFYEQKQREMIVIYAKRSRLKETKCINRF